MSKERRQHHRYQIDCPVTVLAGEVEIAHVHAHNLSDGGLCVPCPAEQAPQRGQQLLVRLKLPRTTPASRMLEDFELDARVVHVLPGSNGHVAVGLVFQAAQDFAIEV